MRVGRATGRWLSGLLVAWRCGCAPLSTAGRRNCNGPRSPWCWAAAGARGVAHIGVLKLLEAEHIPVDYVVGTSMGAIIGGLYAEGMSPEEIESKIRAINWPDVFKEPAAAGNPGLSSQAG